MTTIRSVSLSLLLMLLLTCR